MVAVIYSASAGFASFFLFLGFGYFDPFHAFVTSVLLQLLLLGVHSRLGPPGSLPAPDLHDDPRWRLALWGQLLLVAQASAFIVAGLVISFVGVTSVFVPEDLEYLGTTSPAAFACEPANPRARGSRPGELRWDVGGVGACVPDVVLVGVPEDAGWLWWTTLISGAPGYAAAIGVHFVVGYENLWHLAPAFAGLALFMTALALTYPYLCLPDPALEAEWARRLASKQPLRGRSPAADRPWTRLSSKE